MKGNLKLISGKRIRSPFNNKTRPTTSRVREALINILGKSLEGASWLDLCSGSGVMACEALFQGVKRVLAIEHQKQTAFICKSNLTDISKQFDDQMNIEVICKDVISFLKKGPKNNKIKFVRDFPQNDHQFDFIFLDPPYESVIYKDCLEILLFQNWIKRTSTLICECSSNRIPPIHNGWIINKKKVYGNTTLIFLTPNLALRYFDDTDSMH